MPIVYVSSMQRSQPFYEHLGFGALSVSEWWTELRAGNGAVLALHKVDETELGEAGRLELAVVATERLEVVMQSKYDDGHTVAG